jgi:WD40 repeat protein
MKDSLCPSDATLAAVAAGSLSAAALDQLVPHLESCTFCQGRLEALDGQPNSVVEVLRHSSSGGNEPPPTLQGEAAAALVGLPERIGVYVILGELGRGGMGVVYKAWQEPLRRLVALKMMLTGRFADAARRARFQTEAEAIARLQHPDIVQVFEIGEHDGQPYFTLEHLDGGSLAEHIAGRTLSPTQAAAWVEKLARAVHYAHERGILHRDLKPSNILRTAAGHLKIVDFGLAKLLQGAAYETRSGEILGTPEYMAPEAAEGTESGPACDIYALGAILYCLLTGRPPFQGPSTLETLLQIRNDQPVPPRRLQPGVPRDLNTVCLKCLEKLPRRRYASALDLADDLARFLDGRPTRARPVGPLGRTIRWARRRPAVAALAAALILVTALGFALVSWQWRAEVVARRVAERLAISLALDEAINRCERSDPAGPLALVRSLEDVTRLDDADLEHVVRINLAGWLPRATRRGRSFGVSDGKTGYVWRLALDRKERVLVTANFEDGAQLWDVASGRRLAVLSPPGAVLAVAISPNGETLLTGTGMDGGHGGQVQRWDAAGRLIGTPLTHADPVSMVAFSPRDSRSFLSVSGNIVRLWSAETGQLIANEMRHPALVHSAAFSPDGSILASAADDGIVRFWDATTGAPQGQLASPHPGPVSDVAFSPNGKLLATGSRAANKTSGEARVWSVDSRQVLAGPFAHPEVVRSVAFGWDGDLLVTGCQDRYVRYFDYRNAGLIGLPVPVAYAVQALLPADNGRAMFFATMGGAPGAHQITLPRPAPLTLRRPISDTRGTIDFDSTGRRVALGGDTMQALIWELPSGRPVVLPLQPKDQIHAVAFRPDRNQILTGSTDGVCRLWDLGSGKLLRETRQPGTVYSLSFRPDGRWFVIGSSDGTARVWSSENDHAGPVLRHGDAVEWATFGRDGLTLLTASWDGRLRKWDPYTGTLLYESAESGSIMSGGLGPDDRLAATVVNRRPVRLWDAQTGQPALTRLAQRTGPLRAATLGPDGRTMVAAGTDFLVRFWDLPTAKPLGPPLPHVDEVYRAVFSPDGSQVVTTCRDKYLRLWKVDPPLAGSVETIRLRAEVAAGLELGPSGEVNELDEDAIEQRRRRLAEIIP